MVDTPTTVQPRLNRRNHGKGHGYKIDGRKALGVTSVLNALPKDALINWAANVTAAAAIDRWDELGEMPPAARLKELEGARWNVNREATTRGTDIHDLGDKLSRGVEVNVPPALVGPVEAYARFLDRWDIQMIATEAPCANTELGYAGTLDAIGSIGKLGISRAQIDLKSGKGVYESAALQVVAYDECDIWQPEGPDSEEPMPPTEALFIAHILADDVRLLPIENDDRPALFLQFRYLMQTTRWLAAAKDMPPIGAALSLEDTHE